jgi:hypothetical protein
MINIPTNYKNSTVFDEDFRKLIEFFNDLEQKLQYPNCEGNLDAQRILKNAQSELIMWGKI